MYILLNPHVGPSHPAAQSHVFGAEHVAPFSQTGEHIAKEKNKCVMNDKSIDDKKDV